MMCERGEVGNKRSQIGQTRRMACQVVKQTEWTDRWMDGMRRRWMLTFVSEALTPPPSQRGQSHFN